DPILRLILLQRLLDAGTTGSSLLAEGFRDFKSRVENVTVDLAVPWMVPGDRVADEERERADIQLTTLPDIDDSIQKTAALFKETMRSTSSEYRWVGWLEQGSDGRWSLRASGNTSEDGSIVMVYEAPGSKAAK